MRPSQRLGSEPSFSAVNAERGGSRSTCWSVIVRAQGEGSDARRALGELIARYEATVAMLVRAHRYPWDSTPDDLKQQFFAQLIERNDVCKLDRTRGRFRDWLRIAVDHFMKNEWQRWHADKRGNRITSPELFQVAHGCTAEQLFMRQFAEDTVLNALLRHREQSGDPARFDLLQRFLPGPQLDIADIAPLAAAWGIPPNRLAVQIYRLRQKHKHVLRELVADTVDVDPTDPDGGQAVDLEMRELYRFICDLPRHRVVLEDA